MEEGLPQVNLYVKGTKVYIKGKNSMAKNNKKRFSYKFYKVLKKVVKFFYPKQKIYGYENLPNQPCVIVSNHSQLNGPITCKLYFKGEKSIWCAGELCKKKTVSNFAYNDFFKYKPKFFKWWYKFLSFLMTPIFPFLLNNADTIPVYHNLKIVSTYKKTIDALLQNKNVIIFPESHEDGNNIVNKFNTGFVDIAKLYYKKTGKILNFVPMYIAPKLKSAYIGKPIEYSVDKDITKLRNDISLKIYNEITNVASSLKKHKVVPFKNVPKRFYKNNVETSEESICK